MSYLEPLLPEMAAFGESLCRALPGIAVETFSHRHSLQVHSLGLSCFPADSNALDARCVALIVNTFNDDGLAVKGCVQWQAPSFHTEAETAVYENPNAEDLVVLCQQVRRLLGALRAAAIRGMPPL